MSDLTNVNRMATVGQLSASIAHEIRQPLAGILANAQAALRWLEKANVEEAREGLKGIVSDGHRAGDIITNLRAMFKHDVQEKTHVDINKLVLSVLALARIDLQKSPGATNGMNSASSATSRCGGMSERIAGQPAAIASNTATGSPSPCDVETETPASGKKRKVVRGDQAGEVDSVMETEMVGAYLKKKKKKKFFFFFFFRGSPRR